MSTQGQALLERLKSDVLVFDGAMKTMLFQAGLAPGACPELWKPSARRCQGIHRPISTRGVT
jgi:methionine synthase I (cobalamin-dependent)